MPRLTSQASDILRELQGPRSVLRLVGGSVDPVLIEKLGRIGDPMAAPALVRLLIGASKPTVERIAAVVTGLLRSVPSGDLPELDEACRALGANDVVDWTGWRDLTPGDVRVLASSLGDDGAHVLGLTTFHRSGYVREAAAEELDAIEVGGELRYLVLRLNDWVLPVAESARAAVLRRVESKWAMDWVASLPLVSRTRATTRRSHDDLLARVFAFLSDAAQGNALRAALHAPERVTRRLAFGLARGSPAFRKTDVVRLALGDIDPTIRLEAIRHGLPPLDDDELREVLDAIDTNSFMPVRRAGLIVAAERFPDLVLGRAERALMDGNAAVREVARVHLGSRDPERSLASFYRAQIGRATRPARLAAALAGLGETGVGSDAGVIHTFVEHERASVRMTAIRALARLAPGTHGDTFFGALSDVSPRVVREARAALSANPGLIDLDRLREAMQSAPTLRGRTGALALSQSLGKWQNLRVLLDGAMLPELDVAEHARQLLRMWLLRVNRSSVPPRASELADLDEGLSRARFSVDDDVRREILAVLDAWR